MWSDTGRDLVIEMTSSPSVSYLTSQFDDFLFARINEDSESTPLERISAAKRLVAFIAATPGAPSAYLNAKTVCDRSYETTKRLPAIRYRRFARIL
jgi:hypothetical protein